MVKAKKASAKKAKKKVKKTVDPQVVETRRQKRLSRNLFKRMGFERIKSDGQQITFHERTGELDDIFVHENIMVLVEYTVGKETAAHVSKKSILYGKIHAAQEEWIEYASSKYGEFASIRENSDFAAGDYRVKICYISTFGVSEEISSAFSFIRFLDGTIFRYFDALVRTIHKSARFEFFKYLKLDFKEIGKEVKSTSTSRREFEGHVLPESFSSFPKNFKIVSFYADPSTLLTMSYVLRRDSWRDEEAVYQRVLQRGRMNQMRKYLTTEKRVFVNNIIVTLPNDTALNVPGDSGLNIDPKTIKSVMAAKIAVPFRSNVIGIVDGQHRVFCYHEGNDKYEPQIAALRDRQNLLVTGIVFPSSYTGIDRRRFEAKLFLEINDKQKRTGSELKQSIELILNPYSPIAIAKSVVHKLNAAGALKGLLQTNYFDPPRLIRTTSIVSYGLRPLLKLDGVDSLFGIWRREDKDALVALQSGQSHAGGEVLLGQYIDFASDAINALLISARKEAPEVWRISEDKKDRVLSPTIINGFIVCLRMLAENGKVAKSAEYDAKLKGLGDFDFGSYKSSAWRALGAELYKRYFA